MRIAVFTNKFPHHVSTFFARDMRALINAGIDVDIFPFYPLDPDLWRYVPQLLNEEVLPRNKVHHISILKGLASAVWPDKKLSAFYHDVIPISRSAVSFGAGTFGKSIYVALKALAWARQSHTRYDHVLAYWGNYAATCAYLFHRLIDQPIPFSMFLHAGTDLYHSKVFIREKLLYADRVIVVCDFNREFLSQNYNDIFPQISKKIYKYHLGIDFSEYNYVPNGRATRKLLAVGGLNHFKGFDYLIRAAHVLKGRGLNFEIEIIGDGEDANSLKRIASDLGMENNVQFAGWLPPDEVRRKMSQATILVHPSVGLGDGVPTVIKEAMALGLPVIASNLCGIPELLDGGRCGLLTPPGNVEALAAAMESLLVNNQLCGNYRELAREYAVETFDLWRNGKSLANMLRSTTRTGLRHY